MHAFIHLFIHPFINIFSSCPVYSPENALLFLKRKNIKSYLKYILTAVSVFVSEIHSECILNALRSTARRCITIVLLTLYSGADPRYIPRGRRKPRQIPQSNGPNELLHEVHERSERTAEQGQTVVHLQLGTLENTGSVYDPSSTIIKVQFSQHSIGLHRGKGLGFEKTVRFTDTKLKNLIAELYKDFLTDYSMI